MYSSHHKKVVVVYPNEVYIAAPCSTASLNQHAKASLLSGDQLTKVLLEHHTQG
jgi:hypothetical protein